MDVLKARRTDNGSWAVPGGAIDLGESVAQAAVRETFEETGIECAITGIAGIYSDPKHVILHTSNGEARQEFSIVLTAHPLGGQPTPSSESSEVRWVPEAELPGYTSRPTIHPPAGLASGSTWANPEASDYGPRFRRPDTMT